MDKVYKVAKIKMSTKAMANFLWAVITCKAMVKSTLSVGVTPFGDNKTKYTQAQMAKGNCDVLIYLPQTRVHEFEETSGCTLCEPENIKTNKP